MCKRGMYGPQCKFKLLKPVSRLDSGGCLSVLLDCCHHQQTHCNSLSYMVDS